MSEFYTEEGGAQQEELISMAKDVLVKNYRQQPVVMAFGQGMELWDVSRTRYLDMTGGIAVCCLGHAHPALRRALADQANLLLHTSNLYYNEQQIRAAAAITQRCFGDRVFFCNSGAEANEAALKLARRYQAEVAGSPERTLIVSTEGSFHGRSFATVAVTGQDKYRQGFGPHLGPVERVAFGDLEAARRALEPGKACAFLVEPIQAEGGIISPPSGYLAGLRKLCDETGTLLIFDEVQTGVGRTGRWFAHQWEEGAEPDVMTLAKALAGGVPIGALVASEKAAQGLAVGESGAVPHASTFGGNPLACAAAVAVLETIEAEGLLENCRQAGDYLGRRLSELAEKHPGRCQGARGTGLLRGLVLEGRAAPVVMRCREKGVLFSLAGGNVVRFAPALIVRKKHIDEAIEILDRVLGEADDGS